MRHLAFLSLGLIAISQPVLGGMFGGSSSTTAADSSSSASTSASSSSSSGSSSSSSSNSSSGSNSSSEVTFLQTLQTAQISSMSCLITLVNMTTQPIGTCLGLSTLSTLLVHPSNDTSFSDQLNGYLGTVCGQQCTTDEISDAQGQLESSCQGSKGTWMIQGLEAVLQNYGTSYRTLACSVH